MKANFIHSRVAAPDLAVVELLPQTQTPLVAIDRRWCCDAPVTLHVQENPVTRKIKVRNHATKQSLFEIHRVDSTQGDLFHVFDAATKEHTMTVDGFGYRGRFDVFRGLHEQGEEREPGLFTSTTTQTETTLQFQDVELRRPSRVLVGGGVRDRVALVSVHQGVSWHPIARINRPEHSFLVLPYYTLEIAPGVDAMLPLVLWLARWALYELEQRIGARPTSGPFWGQPNPGTTR